MNEHEKEKQGKLKIFFGYASGVGKTYAMLEAAHAAKKLGVDVVAGYIDPHTPSETLKLLDGLETLPALNTNNNGIILNEFDIDTAIKRRPQLILVDELAHSNADGCRHAKRYNDIQELLKAGIDVYTTVNVQHIESLNDIVSSITGITVKERIPDKVFDEANQVELVDIEPEELIHRFHQERILDFQSKQPNQNFFIKQNLVALREIALRRTADQINKQAEKNKAKQQNEYYTNEHILICLSSSPSNAKVIRTAARMSAAFHGTFTALFVETSTTSKLTDKNRMHLRSNLKLAEQLGAKIATVYGENVAEQIAEYAKASGVSKIVLGRSTNKKRGLPKQSFIDRLIQLAPSIDVYIIPDSYKKNNIKDKIRFKYPLITLADSLKTLIILAFATLLCLWFYQFGFSQANIITVYILGALIITVYTKGKVYSTTASLVGVLILNFFFAHPDFTFQAYDKSYPVTILITFIAVAITITLTMRTKQQSHFNAIKARSTEVLLETSQKLQRAETKDQIYRAMGTQMQKLLNQTVIIYPVSNEKTLCEPLLYENQNKTPAQSLITTSERSVAEWVLKNNKNAGATTSTFPGSKCMYFAVRGHDEVFAVVAFTMKDTPPIEAYEKNLLISMLGEFGLVLEKDKINEVKNEIYVQAQREQLRANLLRAISHDLRTPLTSISGNAAILMGNSNLLNEDKKMLLYTDIYDDSMWLINLVENLLSVTRIEDDAININMQPELLDEVITEALQHINRKSVEYHITTNLSDDLLMAKMDSRLIVQVIINIVDNAIKYTDPGSNIDITTKKIDDKILVEISDNGTGISDEDKKKLFDMFFTANKNKGDSRRGLGLGLSLCKSIIHVHGGEISVKDNIPHGTVFSFTLQATEVNFHE